MILQSKWRNAVYIVRPTMRRVELGIVTVTPGLRAEFLGSDRTFDSERAAQANNWTEEEKHQVERHLVKHKDFGNGIYLAAGEELPEYLKSDARVKPEERKVGGCLEVSVHEGKVTQCPNEPEVGQRYCKVHRKDSIRITKGMATAE